MSLTEKRLSYEPFEYQKAYDFGTQQLDGFWLARECSLANDVLDWHTNLSKTEKDVIAGVLKGFTQSELVIGDYWTNVPEWFPKPEIAHMARTFGCFEAIHAEAYNHLSKTLDINDFDAFLQDPVAKAKLENLMEVKSQTEEEIAKSLAIFSAFAEGVSLFSSFAILMRFPAFNKMKGLGTIIEYSSRDEDHHSSAGIWLFNTFLQENPKLRTTKLKNEIYEAAEVCVKLEEDFIDSIFNGNSLPGLNPVDIKNYIRARANRKLVELGYTPHLPFEIESAKKISSWFEGFSKSVRNHDFFVTRETNYSWGDNFDPAELVFDSSFLD